MLTGRHKMPVTDTGAIHGPGTWSVFTSDLGVNRQPWCWGNQAASLTVKLGQTRLLTGPYNVLFDLRSHDKKLSNVIRSNWNDDINYSVMHSCYWPRSSVTAWSGLLAGLMAWGAPAGTARLEGGAERPDCWGVLWIGRQNEREREKKKIHFLGVWLQVTPCSIAPLKHTITQSGAIIRQREK